MGSVAGTAANGVGTLLGNAFVAPFRAIFGGSCEDVCSGTWDVGCFVEHLCVSSLARLFMVLVLIYIMLFFVYLMCKVGIIQFVAKSACTAAAACPETSKEDEAPPQGPTRRSAHLMRMVSRSRNEREQREMEQSERRDVVVGEGEEEGQATAVAAPEEAELDEGSATHCAVKPWPWERRKASSPSLPCRVGEYPSGVLVVAACPWLRQALMKVRT